MHTFALALAYVSAAIVVATVLPQLARTIRHPGLTGVSPVSWTLTAASSLSWLAYGLLTATPFQIPGNVVLCTGSVALVLLVPSRWRRGHRAVVVGGALVVVIVAALTLPPSIVGYIGFSLGLVASWPQLVDSFGSWRAGEESGVAIGSWIARLVSGAGWFTYAVIMRDTPVLVASVVGLVTTVAVLSLETSARSAARRAAAAETSEYSATAAIATASA